MTRASAADQQASWFQDEAAILDELRRIRQATAAPPTIPGYDEFEELHRGGQGVVYAAVQRSTRRKVAIKVLVDGALASDAARLRFDREIDLVAGLNHPNIVRIYDSGVSQPPDARTYFVMEFIEGVPLHEFARNHRGDARTLLGLFARICRAVSYAHQRGVIHRDLKPSNIRIDQQGEPHVLDFGLAKITAADDREMSRANVVSVAGQFLGSLPWASPEQAQGEASTLDVRSDVYSLGVILYQMLTDAFPYDVDASLRNVLDSIVNDDPVRPSTVDDSIKDEVETIILTCLAKEPDRRYQSAAELALDVERYLRNEPIQAKRDSAWYTMRKRLRHYRMLGAAAALLALTLSAGVAATLWQAAIADRERDAAEERFDDVRQLARFVLFDLHDQIVDLAGSRPAREALVTTALGYLEDLAIDAGDDSELLAEIATGYIRVGDLQGRPNVPNLGDTAGALASYTSALAVAQRVKPESANDPRAATLLVQIHQAIGEVQAARGAIDDALVNLNTALTLAQQLPQDLPGTFQRDLLRANVYIKLGDTLGHPGFANAGKTRDAVNAYDKAEDILEQRSAGLQDDALVRHHVAMVSERQGTMLETHGEPAEALKRYQFALALRQTLVDEEPGNDTRLRDLAITHEKIGGAFRTLGQLENAQQSFAQAAIVFDMLLAADPGNVNARMTSALNHERMAHITEDMGDAEGAVKSAEQALNLFIDLARRDPENEQAQMMAAVSRINYADVLGHPDFANMGRVDEAIEQYERALATFTRLHEAAPDHLRRKRFRALVCERLGTMMIHTQHISEARHYFTQSQTLREQLALDHPEHIDIQRDLGIAHEKIGLVLEHEQDFPGAVMQYTKARDVYTSLAQRHPDTPQFTNDITVVQQHIDRCTGAMNSSE